MILASTYVEPIILFFTDDHVSATKVEGKKRELLVEDGYLGEGTSFYDLCRFHYKPRYSGISYCEEYEIT